MSGSAPTSAVEAYDQGATAWGSGADPAYRRFAEALLTLAPADWGQGARVADVAAGSGAVSTALRALGARPVAVDAAVGMLRAARSVIADLPVVAGDALALPLRRASMEGVAVGFCINHVPEPHRLLAEAARITTPGGVVLASTFARGPDHRAKELVERAARDHGWQPSEWYTDFRDHARRSDTPHLLTGVAQRAGLTEVVVRELDVDTGIASADSLVSWRLGTPELAAFVGTLDVASRRRLRRTAAESLGPDPAPLVRRVLLVSGQVRP